MKTNEEFEEIAYTIYEIYKDCCINNDSLPAIKFIKEVKKVLIRNFKDETKD